MNNKLKRNLSKVIILVFLLNFLVGVPESIFANTIEEDSGILEEELDIEEEVDIGEDIKVEEEVNLEAADGEKEPDILEKDEEVEYSKKGLNQSIKSASDIITSLVIKDVNGNDLNQALSSWEKFRIVGEFKIPTGVLSEGSETKIKLPNKLKFTDATPFEIKDNLGKVVANATVNPDTKEIILKYTKFVEENSDIFGSFFFYAKVDEKVVKDKVTITDSIDVDGVTFPFTIDYNGPDKTPWEVSKGGWFVDGSNKDLRYGIAVNRTKKPFPKAVITDVFKNTGVKYDRGSFEILKCDWVWSDEASDWVMRNQHDVTAQYNIVFTEKDGKEGFSIDFGDIKETDGFYIIYSAKLSYDPVEGEGIDNRAELKSEDELIKESTIKTRYQKGGGTAEGATFAINVHKENESKEALEGAEFTLTRDANGQLFGPLTTDSSGNISFKGLVRDNYTLKEVKAPEGYQLSGEEIKISRDELNKDVPVLRNVVNIKEIPTIDIPVRKTWDDDNNIYGKRPDSIKVTLFADGQKKSTVDIKATENWMYIFSNLPKTIGGRDIVYTITEESVPHYTSSIDKYNLTNKYVPEKIDIPVTKTWDDSNDIYGKRPDSIKVNLFADGQKISTVDIKATDNWKYTFKDLDKTIGGRDIVYTITEELVPHYTSSIDKYNLTNKYVPEKINIPVTKTWDDDNDSDGKRPSSIRVNLLADGQKISTVDIKATDNWRHTFKDLDKTKDGREIVYTITEDSIAYYTTTINKYNITNSYKPEDPGKPIPPTTPKISIPVTKTWDDKDNIAGKRPSSIRVNLLADGKKVSTVDIRATDNWKYTFTGLDKLKDGREIVYTISEEPVEDYTGKIDKYSITNSYTPGKVSIPVTKTWDDKDNIAGKRPSSIRVNLFADGKKVSTVDIKATDNWAYTFTGLDKLKDGREIVYTLSEEPVEGYTSKIDKHNIVNKYGPEKIDIPVTKTWDDNNDIYGKRPSSIRVNLFADGKKVSTADIKAKDNWKYTFTDLDKLKDGRKLSIL